LPAEGAAPLDPDTWLSPGSLVAARRAAGGACAAVDAAMAGEGPAFVATRPPGHHAEPARAMGFCFFSHAAVAARRAIEVHGLERVAVCDFDVHHGNGTQAALWDEPRARFVSSHQMPLYPGTGAPDERGAHDQIRNLPLRPGAGGATFARAWDEALGWLDGWAPELVIVSAGFDAHADDPLGGLRLVEADFAAITRRLVALAERYAGGRVVSLLEGGYDLAALGRSARAHAEALGA
jgi:acetoin utilization deacetylase AcuC-like enzyme